MNTKELLNKFEEVRKELVALGLTYGLNDPKVLALSQQLDHLHNQLMKKTS